jgi:hypothetical protein
VNGTGLGHVHDRLWKNGVETTCSAITVLVSALKTVCCNKHSNNKIDSVPLTFPRMFSKNCHKNQVILWLLFWNSNY